MRSRQFLTLAVPLCTVWFVADATPPPSPGPLVTEAMIQLGQVHFSLPNRGTFTIESISHPSANAACRVSLRTVAASLETAIVTGDFTLAVGKKKEVHLKYYPDWALCDGAGTDCVTKIRVDSVDPKG